MRQRLMLVIAVGGAATMFMALLVVPTFFGAGQFLFGGGGRECVDTSQAAAQPGETDEARAIPAGYLRLYKKAGKDFGLPWNLLAGIGKVETGHGTSNLPGVHSGENFAGAGGPMQFLQATWNAFAVDGDKDGKKDRYDPEDAIPGAARYLKHNGAPERTRTAVFMYNHSQDYVDLVLSWAKRYAAGEFTPVQAGGPSCEETEGIASVGDGVIKRIIDFALAQRGKPYVFGANGPDAWDCSSLIQAAYRSVGAAIPRTTFEQWPYGVRVPGGKEKPGDLVFFNSGPGTSANNPGHVGMVIGSGKMIVASCSSCVPPIGVKQYKGRSDVVGFTRPLARSDITKAINEG